MQKVKLWRKIRAGVLLALILSFGLAGCKQDSEKQVSEHPAGEHPSGEHPAAMAATDANLAAETADPNAPPAEHPTGGEHPAGEHPK